MIIPIQTNTKLTTLPTTTINILIYSSHLKNSLPETTHSQKPNLNLNLNLNYKSKHRNKKYYKTNSTTKTSVQKTPTRTNNTSTLMSNTIKNQYSMKNNLHIINTKKNLLLSMYELVILIVWLTPSTNIRWPCLFLSKSIKQDILNVLWLVCILLILMMMGLNCWINKLSNLLRNRLSS